MTKSLNKCENDTERWGVLQEQYEDVDVRLRSIEDTISKSKGFLGGVVFIISCVWAFFTQGWEYIKGLFH